ncbi:MAG: DNA-primase RepB domain-containing protein [Terriglobia bacterium]
MADDRAGETATGKALAMLSAFASVGARAFNLTITNLEQEKVEGRYRPNTPLEQLRRTIGRVLQDAGRDRHNVIIRPRSSTATLIQLDDLDFAKAERLAPYSVIVFQTSPANYQAWVAVEAGADQDFSRRLRKGAGADATASGSTRIAGSLNFKAKYAPAFPRVEIIHANAGNLTSMAALEQAGFVAAREDPKPPRPAPERFTRSGRLSRKKWPSYAMCVQHAPMTHGEDRPDLSRADFTWCRTAIEWGWSREATASRLLELSEKAKENGERYALLTATRAAESVERQPYRAGAGMDPR